MTKLTLILAQGPGKPDGDVDDRLILHLALTVQGHVDLNAYDSAPEPWLATHTRNGADPRTLEVIRLDEGLALQSTSSMDDPVWAFEGHVFRPGELVRMQGPNGGELLFRIVALEAQ